MKKFMTVVAASALTLAMSSTAFAGWQQDANGWRYMKTKDTWLTSQYTEDGYWVDVNGYWDGKPSNATQVTETSTNAPDGLAQYQVLGERILKVTNAVLDESKEHYNATVDIYDTAFMSNEEIKEIKKGDTFELPGLGITVTAQNKANRSVVRSSKNSNSSKSSSESGYKVRLMDAEGNNYILSASRLRKVSADSSTTETVLRPVVSGIQVVVPVWRDSSRVNGTSRYSTTKSLMEKKMMFQGTFSGNILTSIQDTTYNYDTTNTPVYSEDAAHGHLYNKGEY